MAIAPSAADRRVLKHGETFALLCARGDIAPEDRGDAGLYHLGTRFVSSLELILGDGERPLLLGSAPTADNARLIAYLAGRGASGDVGALTIQRTQCVRQGGFYERIELRNHGDGALTVLLCIRFGADFADLFEVRGTPRSRRGERRVPAIEPGAVTLAYEGLDGVVRRTRIGFEPPPGAISEDEARFDLILPARQDAMVELTVECAAGGDLAGSRPTVDRAFRDARRGLASPGAPFCEVETSHPEFNRWLAPRADLEMLIAETADGPYPHAGIPWFVTPFGRDGLLTALSCLTVNPGLARGVLAHLAATQAREVDLGRDAEPGKICHEERPGEMAALGEVPFRRYYGSVDATPLFVLLAGAYHERTGDLALIEEIWPSIELALRWIETFGDADGDGFVEYARRCDSGLLHQGWKDSSNAISHADGRPAAGPVALCEVQAYVYAASRYAAGLAAALGHDRMASDLLHRARVLHDRFEAAFWSEPISTYALALDGQKRPCEVRASNAGHCLFAGIASPGRARRVARTLLGGNSYSGWGVRTLASSEASYNPLSYHNGSVWPHDNALIAAGLGRYGLRSAAIRVMTGLFEASRYFDWRLPELFCGFARRRGEGPVPYPVACAPQAWASSSVYLLLQACLGLSILAPKGLVRFYRPRLPEYLRSVRIGNLKIGGRSLDLLLESRDEGIGVHVLRREGNIRVVVLD